MSLRAPILAALALVAASTMAGFACTGPNGISYTTGGTTSGGQQCAVSDNDAIRLGLEPTCKACHDTGSNLPIFASLDAFENLLVYNPSLVAPGDPDQSKLVALLQGKAQGTYTQMPLTGQPFAKLGGTSISMDVITDWITTLPPPDPSRAGPHRDSPMTRRLRVGELVFALQSTLGFAEVGPTDASAGKPHALWVRDPTALGDITYLNIGATRTWSVLGGGNAFSRVKDDTELSPSALRTITEMSLEWCGDAVGRADQTIFRDAMPTDTSADASERIRANIAYLHLRLLGEPAAPADVDAHYDGVFLPAEPRGAAVAWTEVCAALVRDPRFLTF
jgi:hypothetical protein